MFNASAVSDGLNTAPAGNRPFHRHPGVDLLEGAEGSRASAFEHASALASARMPFRREAALIIEPDPAILRFSMKNIMQLFLSPTRTETRGQFAPIKTGSGRENSVGSFATC